MNKKIRVLVSKPGLDGHYRGAVVLANALSNAGMEVIYTGLRKTPDEIVATAIDEDVDVIGLSILSGAHIPITKKIKDLMDKNGLDDVLLLVGGIIPDEDIDILKGNGVDGVFQPGDPITNIIQFIEEWYRSSRANIDVKHN
jgi:methylmalonyl-CoA mutase, C-terminal domain